MCLSRCVALEENKVNDVPSKIFASEKGEFAHIAYGRERNEKLPYLYVTRIAVSTNQGGHNLLCLQMRETLHIQRVW